MREVVIAASLNLRSSVGRCKGSFIGKSLGIIGSVLRIARLEEGKKGFHPLLLVDFDLSLLILKEFSACRGYRGFDLSTTQWPPEAIGSSCVATFL